MSRLKQFLEGQHSSAKDQNVHAEMLRLIAFAIERSDPEILRDMADKLDAIDEE